MDMVADLLIGAGKVGMGFEAQMSDAYAALGGFNTQTLGQLEQLALALSQSPQFRAIMPENPALR